MNDLAEGYFCRLPAGPKTIDLCITEKQHIDVTSVELKNREPRPLELVLLKNRRGRAYQVIDVDYWPKQNFFVEV